MTKPLPYHKLRIAWSVVWGVVAMLLVVLWVRTQFVCETVAGPLTRSTALTITSRQGGIGVGFFYDVNGPDAWTISASAPDTKSAFHYPTVLDFGFARLNSRAYTLYIARLPYWALISVASGLSLFARPRISLRFTTRTLLIATTLVAIVLG